MSLIALDEAKTYLRVDCDDEDELLIGLIATAEDLCASTARIPIDAVKESTCENIKTAVLYTVAYLFEHREEADHHALQLTLRALLFGQREAAF